MMRAICYIDTPVGKITVVQKDDAITGIYFANAGKRLEEIPETKTDLLKKAELQLQEYFAGTRRSFELPLAPDGTVFQRKVWEALRTIPYGETRSYRQIAEQIGAPKASRAVGMANNRNPISIAIPCHRVIGSNGGLVGYGGGLDAKRMLLELEKQI